MAQDKFIIKNGAVIESVLAGETVFDVQKTDKSSILGINSDGTINLIGNVNPSGNFTNKLKITNGGISVTGVTTVETIFYDSSGGIVLRGRNTGDQDLSDLATYDYVDENFLKLTGGTMTGSLYVNDTTNSSSTTTGAIRTSGGLGVVGNANFGGTLRVAGSTNNGQIFIDSPIGRESMLVFTQNSDEKYRIGYESSGGYVYSPYGYLLRYDFVNTRLGIGTNKPQYNLDVNGTLRATGAVTFNNSLTLNGESIYSISPNTTSSWARGMHFFNYSAPSTLTGGVGSFGDGSVTYSVYIGMGTSPWSNKSLRITTTMAAIDLPLYSSNLITAARFYAEYDSGVANSMSCSNWFRSSGNTGWYNATYDGGITMTDYTYVRVHNNKAFKVSSTASDSINTDGGILAGGNINVFGIVGFGGTGNKCQMICNSNENSIDFIIN